MTVNEKKTEFEKNQILESAFFTPIEKDVLNVILQPERYYTVEQAREELTFFMAKEVN